MLLFQGEQQYIKQELRPYQVGALNAIDAAFAEGKRSPLVCVATGGGKALAVDTRVLVPSGDKRMGDVRVGDSVIGSDGRPTLVKGVYPQGIREAYKITFSDGMSIICDANHLWAVRTRYDKYHSKQPSSIESGTYRVMTTGELMGSNLRAGDGNRWFIPVVSPIQFEKQLIELDPYLLGLLIGDGYIGQGTPSISTSDDEILASVATNLPEGVHVKHRDAYDWALTTSIKGKGKKNPLTELLRHLGLWGKKSETKFIPLPYLHSTVEDRIAILQGLMDTDGYIDVRGHYSFTSVSEQLAEDVAFLVQSLGGIAPIKTKKTSGQLSYNVYMRLPNEVIPFRLTRKRIRWQPYEKYFPSRSIETIEPSGNAEMVCIAVDAPDNLYVIEHGVVTHNTTIMAEFLRTSFDVWKERALVIGHTEEIVRQTHGRILNQFEGVLTGHYGEFMRPGIGVVMAEENEPSARIVVASRQSLHAKRLPELLKYGAFDVLIIDEAHHALDKNSYGAIVKALREANPALRLVGFTATPSRTDEEALASVFDGIVYEWLIPQGVADGYLVPPTRLQVATRVSLTSIHTQAGDYKPDELVSALDASNWLGLCMEAFAAHLSQTEHKVLAFMPSVEMSQSFSRAMQDAYPAWGAFHLDGTTDKGIRRKVLSEFSEGTRRFITNYGVLGEGFDAPATSAIFWARPTRSRTLLTQCIGRGLRPAPGKHDCLIVDMTVLDTRALEIGTLLGRTIRCLNCKVEYYAALKMCPQCGHQRPASLKEQMSDPAGLALSRARFEGSGLTANIGSLFEQAFAAWYHGVDGFLSCTLSFEDGAFIIVPPLEDNLYRLVHVPKDYAKKIEFVARNESLSDLMLDADTRVRKAGGSQKDAGWRSESPSDAQLGLLAKLGTTAPQGATKGLVSQLLTHTLAVKRLLKDIE